MTSPDPARSDSIADAVVSTMSGPELNAELSRLDYALRARATRNPWGSADAADIELRQLREHRRSVLEELQRRAADPGVDAENTQRG